MDIYTRRGTNLPLDGRRRDALATYAKYAAEEAGVPPQTWVRREWGLKDYEAKDLLKGNASDALWERIAKLKTTEHAGFRLVLAVYGAVLGHSFDDFIATEKARHERARKDLEERERRLVEMAADLPSVLRLGSGRAGGVANRRARERRSLGG